MQGCGIVSAQGGKARGGRMAGDVLAAPAQFVGQAVAEAAVTDVWESVRGRFARLLGPQCRPED